ncbi:MAG TPA: F0F1 ATP synthase subunit B [Oscillospiraceae bacterium]|nr:F0F1 ATP synthase subunit B [Oscillospiraceae bacterium]HPF55759.1 F0F1 ATP synthase subunit B [Clostridiales bacterium]HPK35089.1 F0F1 ATP synthase subunit B [Oscillospiraceae bacterium]HPR75240.1 F0F1 ATP synthase subunit B [Oscillospiraceae bacterium]
MNLDPIKILYHIINLIILFVFFRFLLFKPVMKFINKRKDKVNAELDGAAKAEQESKAKLDQYNTLLSQADEDGRKAADRIIDDAKKEVESMIGAAKTQADELLKQAETKREEEIRKAREGLQKESVTLAVDIAGQILQKEMTESEQIDMINRYVDKFN